MPTPEEKERLILAALRVNDAYNEYAAAMQANYEVERDAINWPVADILACAFEARKRCQQPYMDEDTLLTLFEQQEPGIRDRYAKERKDQLAELNGLIAASAYREGVT